jgi:hypothetical protein
MERAETDLSGTAVVVVVGDVDRNDGATKA